MGADTEHDPDSRPTLRPGAVIADRFLLEARLAKALQNKRRVSEALYEWLMHDSSDPRKETAQSLMSNLEREGLLKTLRVQNKFMFFSYESTHTVTTDRGQTVLTGQWAYYNIYACKDGKFLTVGAFEPWFWANLCRLVGVDEFAERQHPDSDKEAQAQIQKLREVFLTKDRDEWIERLMFEETCVTPVLSLDEVVADRNHRSRGGILSGAALGEGFDDQVGMLYRMSKTPGSIRRPAPKVGQDTRDLLVELGFEEPELDALEQAISTP